MTTLVERLHELVDTLRTTARAQVYNRDAALAFSASADRLAAVLTSAPTEAPAGVPVPSITLRDWYIGQAMAGMLSFHNWFCVPPVDLSVLMERACLAADAALKARGAPPPATTTRVCGCQSSGPEIPSCEACGHPRHVGVICMVVVEVTDGQ